MNGRLVVSPRVVRKFALSVSRQSKSTGSYKVSTSISHATFHVSTTVGMLSVMVHSVFAYWVRDSSKGQRRKSLDVERGGDG